MNFDSEARDRILFANPANADWGRSDLKYVTLSLENVQDLWDNNFIDPDECQNDSPTTRKFYNFMKKFPGKVFAHGYATSLERGKEDYRVTIEGLLVNQEDVTEEIKKSFKRLCSKADELELDTRLYSWWD